ncbi:ribonuclease H1 small subunit [Cylindrobasidium torrendii FP15055 ss-10]|uniref:Ribonuclease H1 small subunit n=1 Tax=Cylindrobasidium torrendii FP15055 ss-10 TaxID=1314674 RepID=A0A0D7BGS3_9AGAR|nr:ribonuclease H1 small subunit [Cylindrobasidium torrendii FP15055 ss-10]
MPSPLPTVTPWLMPWSIKFDGTAPVSTYMRVKQAQTENLDATAPKTDANASEGAPTQVSVMRQTVSYLVSAFRGRTIHGKNVALPVGYVGAVLASTSKTAGSSGGGPPVSKSGRPKRGKKVEKEDIRMDVDEPKAKSTSAPVEAKFSEFTLWLPDNLSRERDDTYVRALDEWVNITALVHRIPTEEEMADTAKEEDKKPSPA